MKNNVLISVIIPVYNGDRYLAETIESVLGQTYSPIEIIVVDDGSTDRSAEIAKSYAEIDYIYQSNQGVSVARNNGIAAANGEFIAFIDADDVWTSDKLSVQIDLLLNNPDTTGNMVQYRNFLESGISPHNGLSKDFFDKIHIGYIPSTLVVRKTVFEKVGLFNPSYRYGEDFDWFVRVQEAGLSMPVIDKVLVNKRYHDLNLSYQSLKDRTCLTKIFKASLERKRNSKVVKKELE